MTILGTTEASIVCSDDALGLTAVRARNRSNEQGVIVETGTAEADLVLKNSTGSCNFRFVGTTLSVGDLTSPGMTLSDTGISLLKDVTVSTHLGISGTFVAGGAASCLQGLKVTGIINALANSNVGVLAVSKQQWGSHVILCVVRLQPRGA